MNNQTNALIFEKDTFARSGHITNLEKRFLKSIHLFSDNELITALCMQYSMLSDNCANKLIEQIHKRTLSKRKVRRLYKAKKFYKDLNSEDCPCCESSQHVIIRKNKVSLCLVCGYNIKLDNPKTYLNRLKWKMGVYRQRKLSLAEVEKLLFQLVKPTITVKDLDSSIKDTI